MDKKYYFISGLPRSGSTLLVNLLNQNPRFYASGTSGIMDVMFGVRNQWDKLIEFQANKRVEEKRRVLKAIFEVYYSGIEKPVIFDKCRGWLSLIEMAEEVLDQQIKILVPVRDIRDVLASFEKLWRKQSKLSQVPTEASNYFQFQTVEGRCFIWANADQPIGLAYNRIKDAIQRGYRNRLHFVKFNQFTSFPKTTMKGIYRFLEEEYFEHDFDHIEQVIFENDEVYGYTDLHTIQSKIEPKKSDWIQVIGKEVGMKYQGLNLWDE